LVHDHNSNWCTEFKKSKTKYAEMLKEAVRELKDLLKGLAPPSIKDLKSFKGLIKKQTKKSPVKQ